MIKRDTLQEGNLRTIKSFVPREGRMTPAHKTALEDLWPLYGLTLQDSTIDFTKAFGRDAPLVLEIGFGDGRSLLNMALQNPQHNFIGIEVYRTGIAKLLLGMKESKMTNVRVFCADAKEVLEHCVEDNSLSMLQLFFPDPWPKARHHKRRIVQLEFIELVRRKLNDLGTIHMATDWEAYAEHMLCVMQQAPGWLNLAPTQTFIERPDTRPLTKFEQRGHRLGYGTWDLMFRKSLPV